MKNLTFPFDSQVYSLFEEKDTVEVNEHYNIRNMEQIVQSIGFWNNTGISISEKNLYGRRKNLHGLKIRAETMPEAPYGTFKTGKGKIEGIIGELWHTIIEKSLNITTIISTPPDNNWGSQNENGSWNGMVGGILESRIDVVLASLYKSPTRGEVIDFSATIDEIVTRMFIKFPQRDTSWTTFVEPFHGSVWMALLLLMIAISGTLYSSYYFGLEEHSNNNSFTLLQTLSVVWGSIIAQGSSLEPKSISSKISFILSFLLGVLAVSSYNATLI